MARRNRTVRLSDEEWAELRRHALARGLGVSAYVRSRLFDRRLAVPKQLRTRATRRLVTNLETMVATAERREQTGRLTLRRTIRFSPIDWEKVCARAELVSMSPARYVRFAALGQKVSGRLTSNAVRQLAGAANNLNQLARWANTHRRMAPSTRLDEVLTQVEEALREIL